MKLKLAGAGECEVEILERGGKSIRARIDGREVTAEVDSAPDGGAMIEIAGERIRVFAAKLRNRVFVACGPISFEFSELQEGRAKGSRGLAAHEIAAPMPGKVLRVLVKEGDLVAAGDGLVVIEAMKMETTLAAESPARIKKIRVEAGQMVDHGAVLIELAALTDDPSARESLTQGR